MEAEVQVEVEVPPVAVEAHVAVPAVGEVAVLEAVVFGEAEEIVAAGEVDVEDAFYHLKESFCFRKQL